MSLLKSHFPALILTSLVTIHKTEFMITLIRNTCLVFAALSLMACASPPRAVDAKIPLVDPSSFVSDESIPPAFWGALNDARSKHFTYDTYLVELSPKYFSALGTQCRQLTFMHAGTKVGQRVACANVSEHPYSQWFLTKALSDEQTVIGLR